MSTNRNAILVMVILSFCLGGIGGYFAYNNLGFIADSVNLKYVAEEEIMELERSRLKEENVEPAKQNLFFGDIARAVELTMSIAASYNDRTTRVIFSLSPVFAEKAESVSAKVHQEVIERMRNNEAKGKESN